MYTYTYQRYIVGKVHCGENACVPVGRCGERTARCTCDASVSVCAVRGCADLSVSDDRMSVERVDDVATVTCNETGERWHALCRHGRWFGAPLTNCTSQRNYIVVVIIIIVIIMYRMSEILPRINSKHFLPPAVIYYRLAGTVLSASRESVGLSLGSFVVVRL